MSYSRGIATALLLGLASVLAIAAAPATQPAQQIRDWFERLADPSADVREQALEGLMGLRSEELPLLRQAVAETRPLLPSQKSVLREIVLQVYMSGIPYDAEPGDAPFLGLLWTQNDLDSPTAEFGGVVAPTRLPGFTAYQKLHEGDVIFGIRELPGASFGTARVLTDALRTFRAGQTISLLVIREGRRIVVPVLLRQKPAGVDSLTIVEWIQSRQGVAEEYWDSTFAALVGDEIALSH